MSIPLKLAAAASTIGAIIAVASGFVPPLTDDPTEIVILAPARFEYRAAGEFSRDGVTVNAPLTTIALGRPLAIMKHHVSRADYQRCVAAKGCRQVAGAMPANAAALPVVGVNWNDATDYAAWLSRESGRRYRLPTDAEWAYAAGSLFSDTTIIAGDGAPNQAARWIAAYESEAAAAVTIDTRPQPFGTFGVNEHGLDDIAGNVWDWTSTCFVRNTTSGGAVTGTEICGVRVVEGRHRAYLTDFIREPKGGSCSVGTPPANLGIRLVRDDTDGIAARVARGIRGLLAGRS